jgi:hypothetical protein
MDASGGMRPSRCSIAKSPILLRRSEHHVAPANKNSVRTKHMSDSLVLDPSPRTTEPAKQPTHRFSLGAVFHNVMESLVAAHGRQFEASEQTFYRYPPI